MKKYIVSILRVIPFMADDDNGAEAFFEALELGPGETCTVQGVDFDEPIGSIIVPEPIH
jgi:hypothetical protein